MVIKVNKRLMKIIIGSLIVGLVFAVFYSKRVDKMAQQEARQNIAYFKKDLKRGDDLDGSHIEFKETPVSLIPEDAIKSEKDIKGKSMITDVVKEDYVLSTKLTERGDIKIDVNDMWVIGIDIDNISNFMGVRLKEGDLYGLEYIDKEGLGSKTYKIKVVELVNSDGKIMAETDTVAPKTVNVAVDTEHEMKEIAQGKRNGTFDIVKPSDNWLKGNVENVESQR